MGARYDMVPLNRVRWNIVPARFVDEASQLVMDDPEIPHLKRLYTDCYWSVFHCKPYEDASRFAKEIKKNAIKVPCSVRMFILANMVAQREHEKQIIQNTEKLREASFRVKMLTGELAVKRARVYQELCQNEFGTFSLSSLSVLAKEDMKDNMDDLMLRSEATAATWFVRYKIFNGGPASERLYESEELQLAPEWLALEQTYIDTILKPYIERKISGSEMAERHRFNAFQVHCQFKKNLTLQRMAWVSRQRIMSEAVGRVLAVFDHQPADFLYPREPETDPMRFWMRLALTIRHYHCWLYLNGQPSFFTPRRNETRARRS